MLGRTWKKTSEVFGMSNTVLPDSYVDRGALDDEVRALLGRPTHIALRGESKCGKSWLRQTVLPEALVVQCRLGKTVIDVYRDALSQLDVRLEISSTEGAQWTGRVEAQGEVGVKLLAKLGVKSSLEATQGDDAHEGSRARHQRSPFHRRPAQGGRTTTGDRGLPLPLT